MNNKVIQRLENIEAMCKNLLQECYNTRKELEQGNASVLPKGTDDKASKIAAMVTSKRNTRLFKLNKSA